jgi:hypothetical protein
MFLPLQQLPLLSEDDILASGLLVAIVDYQGFHADSSAALVPGLSNTGGKRTVYCLDWNRGCDNALVRQ